MLTLQKKNILCSKNVVHCIVLQKYFLGLLMFTIKYRKLSNFSNILWIPCSQMPCFFMTQFVLLCRTIYCMYLWLRLKLLRSSLLCVLIYQGPAFAVRPHTWNSHPGSCQLVSFWTFLFFPFCENCCLTQLLSTSNEAAVIFSTLSLWQCYSSWHSAGLHFSLESRTPLLFKNTMDYP